MLWTMLNCLSDKRTIKGTNAKTDEQTGQKLYAPIYRCGGIKTEFTGLLHFIEFLPLCSSSLSPASWHSTNIYLSSLGMPGTEPDYVPTLQPLL